MCGGRRTTEKTSGESAVHQIAAFTTFAHWPTRKPFMIGSIMFTKHVGALVKAVKAAFQLV